MSVAAVLAHEVDFTGWRAAARRYALAGIGPADIVWSVGATKDLFAERTDSETLPDAGEPSASFTVSRRLLALAETVVQARDSERFALLYALVWRAHQGERHLLEDLADPAVQRALRLAQAVRRDTHKMRAFVRFRAVTDQDATRYVAWFEPDHYIVEANAEFFVRRFATMVWSILTPYRSVHWTGQDLRFAAGAERADVPDDDALEAYWRTYYSSIFNPARLKITAMRSEMPQKYWRNLPEAALIPDLIRSAGARTDRMVEATNLSERPIDQTSFLKPEPTASASGLAGVAQQAEACRRCSLWQPATQLVFGEGPADADLMIVGEQPGDQEDLAGRPFIGPAGQLLDRALLEAGIDRACAYVTNAVKHFKFEPRGKRRIHAKPDTTEITACKVWIDQERATVAPKLTLLLGATAARSVLGRAVTISRERGRAIALSDGTQAFVSVHPSYLLRLPDEDAKQREFAAFVADLRSARDLIN